MMELLKQRSQLAFKPVQLFWHALIVFALGVFYVCWFYLGLPYDFSMDLVIHRNVLYTMSWKELVSYTLNPLTPAWFFMTEIGYLRPVYYMIVKFFFDTFGAVLWPVHVLIAFSTGLLSAVFFCLTAQITKKLYFAWVLALFYLFLPTHPVMLAGYLCLDIQFLHSVLIMSALAILAYFTWKRDLASPKRLLLLASWILLTWIAIKWKSSEKLLPFIYFGFLIVVFPMIKNRIGVKWWGAALAANLLMFLLVVPIVKFEEPEMDYQARGDGQLSNVYTVKDKRMFSMKFENLIYRTFVMPDSENPLLTVELDNPPNSFTGSFGFFAAWFFWISFLLAPFLYLRKLKKSGAASFKEGWSADAHIYMLLLAWFSVTVLAFMSGAPLGEVRYLNFAFVPAILLFAFQISWWKELFDQKKVSRWAFLVIVTAIFVYSIIQNFGFVRSQVLHHGGMQHARAQAERAIYTDFFGEESSWLELYMRHNELMDRAIVVEWHTLPENWYEDALLRVGKEGKLYYLTHYEESEQLGRFKKVGLNVDLLGRYALDDASPLIFKLQKFRIDRGWKKAKDFRKIRVFRVSRAE